MISFDAFMGIVNFIAGLAIFIYGMHIMSSGLQANANSKFKNILAVITKNKFFGVLTGVVVTALIQSSSSTTVMLVGFVNAGLMSLGQAVGVIMGANIGTTVTSWIVSLSSSFKFLKTSFLAPFAIIIGVIMMTFAKKEKTKITGQIIVGFGFLFFGLESMSDTVKPLRDSPVFVEAFTKLGANPVLGILAGTAVTAIVQSSSASVGILQVLAMNGIVTWSAAVFIILGQNIGTCITAILSSIGASKNAKATAYMHLLFNLIGSILFAIVAVIYFQAVPEAGAANVDSIGISVFHTVFNIANTIILFPFANLIVKASAKLAKIDEDESEKNSVSLDERLLETPEIALISVYKEIDRMGRRVADNLSDAVNAVNTGDIKLAKNVISQERIINDIDKNITNYLIKISHGASIQNNSFVVDANRLFHIISDIEQIGDYAEEIAKNAIALIEDDIEFSIEAKSELSEMLDANVLCFKNALRAVQEKDKELCFAVKDAENEIDKLEQKFRDLHIERITGGNCNFATKAYYTDVLSTIERVSDRASNMVSYIYSENK